MSDVAPSFLYHGSAMRFTRPDVSKGRAYKDFGKGFYLSVDRNQAIGMMHKKFAELFSRKLDKVGVDPSKTLYRATIDNEYLKSLKVKVFPTADASWLDFILSCRRVAGIPHDFDVVIGPTADDDTRLLLKNYVDGVYGDPDDPASKETLLRLLKPDRLGTQWFIGKQNVADRLITTFEEEAV